MTLDGTIERREDGSVLVTVLNEPWSKNVPGVSCLNPDAPESQRQYQKAFHVKPIYLPGEYDRAIAEKISSPDNFVVSMNGYSRITDEQCIRYGIQQGAYEEACRALMSHTIGHLKKKFTGAHLRLIHGAADLGVDKAIQEVADEYNIVPLGFSCPRYMLYVNDDQTPVYVGTNQDDYSDKFIQSLDLLITTGGREVTLQHDVLAACVYNKRIHFVDILNSLSSTGGVPATVTGPDGKLRVDNAAAAMGRNVSFFSRHNATAMVPRSGDLWDAIFENVSSIATEVCRLKMSPKRKFR